VKSEKVAEIELGCLEELDFADVDLGALLDSYFAIMSCSMEYNVRVEAGRYPVCSSGSRAR
jgi:hypothetical protein